MNEFADAPRWMSEAWTLFGAREVVGKRANPALLDLYRDAGHADITSDETAWCAAFVGACLGRAGVKPSGSLMARSYIRWGHPLAEPRTGAVAVLARSNDRRLGHVGFVVGIAPGKVILLGGNQGDAVSVAAFDRKRLLGLRWPTAVPTEDTRASNSPTRNDPVSIRDDAAFENALRLVLEFEGGFSDDPADPGGPTWRGITLATFAAWRGIPITMTNRAHMVRELRAISDREIVAIYRARYWTPAHCPRLPPGVRLMHFDAAVNQGVPTAIRLLQAAVETEVDGEFGPLTRAAVASCDPLDLIERCAALRRRRYRALPHFPRFGKGWLARVEKTRRAAIAEAAAETQSATHGDDIMNSKTVQAPADSGERGVEPKWWGHSLTIWGTIVTALATVLPAVGPLIGIEITADLIRQLGHDTVAVGQAVAGLSGTLMAIYGRIRATSPLTRRDVNVRL
ncbi:MAG: TIGR02594 family protein [Hyphomicrobium sp.]|nr:TIGR02594 family protein [Hyphomicrobium sp.]